MKKLIIEFKDNTKITYTMKNSVAWEPYFNRHLKFNMKSAVLQQYPKKDNQPIILL